ncbi:Lipoprotein-releasing system ATP-binding protein LolD [hydrothermal vent metagenome]|uniref:Lipoprotein-releasing system ATP-binding protein LolD n=1 Tax=hydrothermal vent metagenome TaxID=652676 RepID=A0A3B0ZWS0_9ZZZZ
MNNNSIVHCTDLSKHFDIGPVKVEVLKHINISISKGEQVSIIGSSGSGKSTLLHLLGGLDIPTQGSVYVNGNNMADLSDSERGRLRNTSLGFVYQFHHLLPEFNALENVAMPLLIRGVAIKEAQKSATEMLSHVGLAQRLQHKPSELSGGERQRAAIARALVTKPKCVLADEPTGNLDASTAVKIYELMMDLNREFDTSYIVVTHDTALANKMDRVLHLKDGVLT